MQFCFSDFSLEVNFNSDPNSSAFITGRFLATQVFRIERKQEPAFSISDILFGRNLSQIPGDSAGEDHNGVIAVSQK